MLVIEETHRILAGDDFDGTAPTLGTEDLLGGQLVYAPADHGGLFVCPVVRDGSKSVENPDATSNRIARRVVGFRARLAGQASWTLHIVDKKELEVLWVQGLLETDVVITDTVILAPGSSLKFTTVTGVGAMHATVSYEVLKQMR